MFIIKQKGSDRVNKKSFEVLSEFLYQYNKYIVNFFEYHDNGSEPVDMIEYFNNDFTIYINNRGE